MEKFIVKPWLPAPENASAGFGRKAICYRQLTNGRGMAEIININTVFERPGKFYWQCWDGAWGNSETIEDAQASCDYYLKSEYGDTYSFLDSKYRGML